MTLKQNLLDRLIQPTVRTTDSLTTIGLVKTAYTRNKICTVIYKNKNGIIQKKENVTVRFLDSGLDYFPIVGDYVVLQLEGDICTIISKYTANDSSKESAKQQISQDIYSDSTGANPGGTIY